MIASGRIVLKKPEECSEAESNDFVSFVRASGEVAGRGIENRVRAAVLLAFIFENNCLAGIAAAKNPLPSYRKNVSEKSHISLLEGEYPYEIGWLFVMPSARRKGYSYQLVDALVTRLGDIGMFATSRTDNVGAHKSLERAGFAAVGRSYVATRGSYHLQLFVRRIVQSALSLV